MYRNWDRAARRGSPILETKLRKFLVAFTALALVLAPLSSYATPGNGNGGQGQGQGGSGGGNNGQGSGGVGNTGNGNNGNGVGNGGGGNQGNGGSQGNTGSGGNGGNGGSGGGGNGGDGGHGHGNGNGDGGGNNNGGGDKKTQQQTPRHHHTSAVGQYFAYATACAAVMPIVFAAYEGIAHHRELPPRDATALVAGCYLPIVGWLVVHYGWNPKWDALYTGPRYTYNWQLLTY